MTEEHSAPTSAPVTSAIPGTWCCEFELSGDAVVRAVLPVEEVHRLARILVRFHGDPLGYLTLPLSAGELGTDALFHAAWEQFGDAVNTHLRREGLAAITLLTAGARPLPASETCPSRVVAYPYVSVVVCTRDRPEVLLGCLTTLQSLTYPHVEVIIVDNAPSDDSTKRLVDALVDKDARFRYVLEQRPGLSCARNRGLAAARGTYVAYTDDDVSVDDGWIEGVVRGFQRGTDVGCVTGLVCSASITNAEEAYFDARAASWSTRFQRESYDLRGGDPSNTFSPYFAGVFGTGANVAFDRVLLNDLGTFDEALGAGTSTRGGEDLDMFVRVLLAGRIVAYEPTALVWHRHRADHAALLKQMFGYGTGLSAFITKCLLQSSTRRGVLRALGAGLRRLASIGSSARDRLGDGVERPRGAMLRELTGIAVGPFCYLRAERSVRRIRSASETHPMGQCTS